MLSFPHKRSERRPDGHTLSLRRLDNIHDPDFAELLALYTAAFPAAERKSVDVLQRMLANPRYRFFVASAQGVCAALAIVALIEDGGAALLEYMAVRSELRGQGFGRLLFAETARTVLGPHGSTLLIEVESDHLPGPTQAQQTRRKLFYRSLGAREIEGLSWVMPPVADTPPPPMNLFAFAPHRSTLPKDTLQRWLARIYVEVYGQNEDDPRLFAMTRALPQTIALR